MFKYIIVEASLPKNYKTKYFRFTFIFLTPTIYLYVTGDFIS